MKEANIITDFKKYLVKNPTFSHLNETTCIEFKICKEKRFSFSKVEPHQIEALRLASNNPFFYKIQDEPFRGINDSNRFHRAKPFDAFYLPKSKGYIGICFYVPKKLKRLFFF